jgi:hypothetical protein
VINKKQQPKKPNQNNNKKPTNQTNKQKNPKKSLQRYEQINKK